MKTTNTPNFFHDKPVFGLDIGHGSLKVMQVEHPAPGVPGKKNSPRVVGYGFTNFDKAAQEDGVIVQPEIIAKATMELFERHLIG
ncbi:MAG TPA: hypothetical protein VN778_04950, partial [Verrucomicrobiae bacterium]|nr:hypothetical protein [Verrucomicrobiae bacterium]